jgi:hypothetical protein
MARLDRAIQPPRVRAASLIERIDFVSKSKHSASTDETR